LLKTKPKAQSLLVVFLILLAVIAIALAIVITPTFTTKYLSSDHDLTPGGIKILNQSRIISSFIGIFLMISASILMKVKKLDPRLQRILWIDHPKSIHTPLQVAILGIFSTLLLFFGFFTNSWQVANENWFIYQNYDNEGWVVGRLVQSHQNGIFSYGGLLGLGSPDVSLAEFEDEMIEYQFLTYTNESTFELFYTYDSQIGGQGILFSVLDALAGFSPQQNLKIFHALSSLLSALVITLIILWFYLEFGLLVSLFALASAVFSPWLVVFGGKLFWSLWSFYLPMVAVMYLYRKRNHTHTNKINLGIILFVAVFVKCLFSGYEFITTTLIMMMVPFVYYHTLRKFRIREFISGLLIATIGSCLAILLSVTILCIQIGSNGGGFLKAFEHIGFSLEKRTYGDPNNLPSKYAASLESHTADVVMTYLKGSFFGPGVYVSNNPVARIILSKIKYLYLIFLFAIASLILYLMRYRNSDKHNKNISLVLATWFSLLAPLSWLIIFKAHSHIHTHMNYIVWQMPFTLFGFALCGFVLDGALKKSIHSSSG
jgi:hypothetical protein